MFTRRLAIGAATGVLGVGMAGPLASADASTPTVRQAITAAEHSFKSNTAFTYVTTHAKKLNTVAELKAAVPKFRTVGKLYATVSRSVASSSATTAGEKSARTLWVAGTKLASEEYAALVTEFTDVLAGRTTAGKASEKTALSYATKASADVNKADKLLGLPEGY